MRILVLALTIALAQTPADDPAAKAAALTAEARRLLGAGAADAYRVEALIDRALALWREAGDRAGEAGALRTLGYATAFRNSAKSIAVRTAAREIFRELGDTAGEAGVLHEIGITHFNRGEIAASLAAYDEALPIARASGDRNLEASILSNTSNAYTWRGDAQLALDAIDAAAAIWKQLGDTSSAAVVERHRGSIYQRLGDSTTALRCFRESLAAARASGSRLEEGYTLSTLGDAYVHVGDDERAMAAYQQALAVWRAMGARRGEGAILGQIGLIEARRGHTARARELYTRGLELARETGYRAAEAATLLNLGALEAAQGRTASAAEMLESSLDLWRTIGDRMGEASALVALARLDRARGGAASARERLDRALAIVESIRGDVRAPDLRGSYLASARRAYEELVDVLLALHRADPAGGHDAAALLVSERARARSLLDLLTAAHATEPVRLLAAEPLPLADIRRRVLDADSVLVEYALGDTSSHVWVVTRDTLTAVDLPPRAQIDAAARRLHRLGSAGHTREGEMPLRRALERVSALILDPIAERLAGKRLLIVPDGALQYVPFAALAVGGATLADRFELVVLPSASTVTALRPPRAGAGAPRSITIVTNDSPLAVESATTLDAGSETTRSTATSSASGGAERARTAGVASANAGAARTQPAPLPFARREADAIAALAGRDADIRVGSAVDRAALADARIIHVASHAVLDVERPERTGIALGRGLFSLPDVYGLHLDADLVVLSACRTALGREVAGEGLIGLTRGFMYAGARSVLASLWDVSDAATATLMTRFYRRLLVDGLTPAAALRDAQRSMAREPRWQSPYYWAGFVLQGEWTERSDARRR